MTHNEAMRCLKRRLADHVWRIMTADDRRAMTGPGGHAEATTKSGAAGPTLTANSSEKSLPGPATAQPTECHGPAPDDSSDAALTHTEEPRGWWRRSGRGARLGTRPSADRVTVIGRGRGIWAQSTRGALRLVRRWRDRTLPGCPGIDAPGRSARSPCRAPPQNALGRTETVTQKSHHPRSTSVAEG